MPIFSDPRATSSSIPRHPALRAGASPYLTVSTRSAVSLTAHALVHKSNLARARHFQPSEICHCRIGMPRRINHGRLRFPSAGRFCALAMHRCIRRAWPVARVTGGRSASPFRLMPRRISPAGENPASLSDCAFSQGWLQQAEATRYAQRRHPLLGRQSASRPASSRTTVIRPLGGAGRYGHRFYAPRHTPWPATGL